MPDKPDTRILTPEAALAEIEARPIVLEMGQPRGERVLLSRNERDALCQTVRVAWAENERLRDDNEALNMCELCDVPINADEGTFNVCGRCFNRRDAALRAQLAQVTQERDVLRDENEVYRAADYSALTSDVDDFRARAVNLCKEKAAKWQAESQADYYLLDHAKAKAATELAGLLESLEASTSEEKGSEGMPEPTKDHTDIEPGCVCQACDCRFKVDVNIPDDLWNRIRPHDKPEGAGLLCGRCIFSRIESLNEFDSLSFSRASVAATPPMCAVHAELDRKDTLILEVGNDCIACSLHERSALLNLLEPVAAIDGSQDSLTVLQNVLNGTPCRDVAATVNDGVGLNLFRQLVGGRNSLRTLGVFPCNNAEHLDVDCKCFWEQCEAWAKRDAERQWVTCADCGKQRSLSTLASRDTFVCRYCLSTNAVASALPAQRARDAAEEIAAALERCEVPHHAEEAGQFIAAIISRHFAAPGSPSPAEPRACLKCAHDGSQMLGGKCVKRMLAPVGLPGSTMPCGCKCEFAALHTSVGEESK